MTYKIYFTKNNIEDYFIIRGSTLEDIKNKTREELEKRGLTIKNNFVWSEEVK